MGIESGPAWPSESETGTEATVPEEVAEVLGVLETLGKIEQITAWLVEAAPGADSVVRDAKRAQRKALIASLGIDPDEEACLSKVEKLRSAIEDRSKHPEPAVDLPDSAWFEQRIEAIKMERARLPSWVHPNAIAVAMDGWSSLQSIQARSGEQSLAEELASLARVMADKYAYVQIFDNGDTIQLGSDGEVMNGRHRALVLRALGPEVVQESGMHRWITVEFEE